MVDEARFLGEPYPQSFVHLIRVEDGAVILQQEFFNSEIFADAERTARAKGRTPDRVLTVFAAVGHGRSARLR